VLKDGDTFPRPDPTKLTTEQLDRETASIKLFFTMRVDEVNKRIDLINQEVLAVPRQLAEAIDHLQAMVETRLHGMDRATEILQEILDRIPRQMDEKITALSKLHEEKFLSIQTQFRERDVRTEESSKDSKMAVAAALQAAKEAVGEQNKSSALAIAKSETSTTKQIDQLGMQVQAQSKNFDDKIADVKDRLTRIEGGAVGVGENERHHQINASFIFSIIAAIVSVLSLFVVIFIALKH
jgi:hypothetical protein